VLIKEKDFRGFRFGEGGPDFRMCIIGRDINPPTYARSSAFVSFLAIAFIISTLTLVQG
jgi:hypothetical protein